MRSSVIGPMVGRRAELATGYRLVDSASRGRGGTLLVTGEAGIGKSRLVAQFTARAVGLGMGVYTGRSVPGGGTYRAVAEALALPLRKRLDSTELRPFRAALSRLVPGWTDAGALGGPACDWTPDPAVVLGEGLLTLLDALSGGAGCLLVLEDLHWADPDTLSLVSYLADAAYPVPVLLVLTVRDEEAPACIAGLRARPRVTELALSRLDAGGVAALAAACRGGTPLPEPELRELVGLTEGLPFLVEELLDLPDPGSSMPPTLVTLVAGRLARLPAGVCAVLEAAAVVGTDLDWRMLQTVTGVADTVVVDALRAATEVGLLAADGATLRWRHSLTREAVLAALLPPVRAALAARVGRALDRYGEPADRSRAATLLAEAGEPQRAAEILVELARRDANRGALRSADELLARATSTGKLAGSVAVERVQVLTLLGRVTEAQEVGAEALCAGSAVGEQHAELCLRLARAAVVAGRWATAEGYLDRAGRPADPRCMVLAADAAFGAGQVRRAAELAGEAACAAQRGGQVETLCEALLVRARSRFGGDLGVAVPAYRRAAQVAAEHALTYWRVEALFGLGTIEYEAGDLAAPSLTAAAELAERAGMLGHVVRIDLLRADAALLVDGPNAARPLAENAAERAGRLRLSALQAWAELQASAYAAMTGDLPAMTALLDAATSRPDAPTEVATLTPLVRAMPLLMNHDVASAAALVDGGISALLRHGSAAPMGYFGLWALLRTAVADRDAAARAALRTHHSMNAVDNRAALGYAEAIAAGREGRSDQASAWFAEANALIAHLSWWNRLLRLLALEAAVVDGWGDPVPALRADLAAHEHAGEPALARTCRDLLRAAGAETRRGRGHVPVPPALSSQGITSREAEVLALVAGGLTNAEVATRLFLSIRTVETHVTSLLRKTGSVRRGDLRAWFPTPRHP